MMSYNSDPSAEGVAQHPTDVQLQAFADGESGPFDVEVASHVTRCLICRVHVGRLAVENRDAADPAFIAALSAQSPEIDPALLQALSAPQTSVTSSTVRVGQLWRAARSADNASAAILVWIRKVFDSTVAVLPVVLDIDLADTETLIVSADSSPLHMELAVFCNIDAEIDVSNLATFIADLNIEDDVKALRMSSRSGVLPPEHLTVGRPIVRDDDQRIEFRHIVSELVDTLYIETTSDPDAGIDVHDLLTLLNELSVMHPGLRVQALPFDELTYVDERQALHPVAAVHHLATCVVVTVIDGPSSMNVLTSPALSIACGEVLARFIEADSIAVCAPQPEWPTVLLAPMDMQTAIEVPAGRLQTASVYGRPLDLSTMLLKHFEGVSDRWNDTSTVHFDELSASLRNVEATSTALAQSAIEEIHQKGKRATIPAKKEGYSRLSADAAARISGLINEVLAGEDPAQTVDELLDDQP
jgi:hypothetical protein